MTDAPTPKPDRREQDLVTQVLDHIRTNGALAQYLRSAAHYHADKNNPGALANDILHGADAIAEFIFGNRQSRKKIYRLVETSKLPHFRLGASICSRKSVLVDWIISQERH